MEDAENNFQPSKKRAAVVQLSRDNPGLDDNEETSEQEAGTFKRASDEVLAARRIVKVRRQTTSTPAAPAPSASNPFAALRLVPPASSAPPEVEAQKEAEQIDDTKSENKVDEPPKDESTAVENETVVNEENVKLPGNESDDLKPQTKDENQNVFNEDSKSAVEEVSEGGNNGDGVKKDDDTGETQAMKDVNEVGDDKEKENGEDNAEKNSDSTQFSSFHHLSSSQNAFSGLSGTGFSNTSFSFGSIAKDGSSLGSTFSFVNSNNGSSSIFGNTGVNTASKSESSKFPPMQEVPVETGEENEKAVFTADSVLFEYIDGAWKERGKGELKVNVPTTGGAGKARLIMRARGNYRLILNASLFADMKLTNMDKRGITFACVNSTGEGKDGLSTFALKFKDASIVEDFRAAVMEHKTTEPVALKTPENSPKADD